MTYIKSPMGIENGSFEIISQELTDMFGKVSFESEVHEQIVKRAIHTAADFDYFKNIRISDGVIDRILEGLKGGLTIYTDTTMVLSGINKRTLHALGCDIKCLIADERTFKLAEKGNMTRSMAAVDLAFDLPGQKLFVIGNAPTALFRIMEHYDERSDELVGVVGVPVGFVGAAESKDELHASNLPHITALGRKGGSNVAAAIVNAMLYHLRRD
ncbi:MULTISPECIES: cobalt-precorrin-8 methylmutase [unclassified Fusibacter]|uniref:cobalt-precorrin-8 methylmutase n=1 Tax=unclassified Fusibacter TaxID=2624464 RepID=UPI0010112312|nr:MULTISPECIES: cobalt-precorrin-8 methylmutase [unclassified Fusibacter]MCK8060505.1 cobalt-precorrin-8 methylmutase [Fusibacter sp. A2]NPE20206.1 cobalt-precorrin-8 methylmutase [Fusibacter sp. A1]RXV63415.1 cobalt-precorrin-8 methylmutase [Fusibacter sp. A1]